MSYREAVGRVHLLPTKFFSFESSLVVGIGASGKVDGFVVRWVEGVVAFKRTVREEVGQTSARKGGLRLRQPVAVRSSIGKRHGASIRQGTGRGGSVRSHNP